MEIDMKRENITLPISGTLVNLNQVSDKLFASGALGKGFAIKFDGKELRSPIDGIVIATFPTGHSYMVRRDDGLEILIHVGLSSSKMKNAFKTQVEKYQAIKKGDLLTLVDPSYFKDEQAYCPVVFSMPDVEVILDKENEHLTCGTEAVRIIW